jgi:hypothetical protein
MVTAATVWTDLQLHSETEATILVPSSAFHMQVPTLSMLHSKSLTWNHCPFWSAFILRLKRPIKETIPNISRQLKLTIHGFSTIQIIGFHGNILK